jgi:hypothetical protein
MTVSEQVFISISVCRAIVDKPRTSVLSGFWTKKLLSFYFIIDTSLQTDIFQFCFHYFDMDFLPFLMQNLVLACLLHSFS